MIEYIVGNRNLYANCDCNNVTFVVAASELLSLWVSYSVVVLYHTLPQTSNVWSPQPDLGSSCSVQCDDKESFCRDLEIFAFT